MEIVSHQPNNYLFAKLIEQIRASVQKFKNYQWPDNTKELINLVEDLCTMFVDVNNQTESVLEHRANFNQVVMTKANLMAEEFDLKQHLEGIEVSLIRAALQRSQGVVAMAARMLGIRRTTLIEKMKKYHIVKNSNVEVPGLDDLALFK